MTNIVTCYSQLNNESVFKDAHATDICDEVHSTDRNRAFLITIVYAFAPSPPEATERFFAVAPKLLSKLIASHWQRYADRGEFTLHAFLDIPKSRLGTYWSRRAPNELHHAYHHHAILLVTEELAERIDASLPSVANLPLPGVKSYRIQRVSELSDVEGVASYAAKAIDVVAQSQLHRSYFRYPLALTDQSARSLQ